MTRVQTLWTEFETAKARLAEVFSEPVGLFDGKEAQRADADKVVQLADVKKQAKRKTAKVQTGKGRTGKPGKGRKR